MLVLLRLLIEHAKSSSIGTTLTNDEGAILNRALLVSTSIAGELSQAATQTRPRLEDWLAFFTQNGAYNSRAQQMGALARAQELFGPIANKSNLLSVYRCTTLSATVAVSVMFTGHTDWSTSASPGDPSRATVSARSSHLSVWTEAVLLSTDVFARIT